MVTKKARPTFEEHVELGRRLHAVDEELEAISLQLFDHYPSASPAHNLAYRALERVRLLRAQLHSASMNDLRGQGVWSERVYYPVPPLLPLDDN